MKTKYEPIYPHLFSANTRMTRPVMRMLAEAQYIETFVHDYEDATKKDYPVN